MQHFPRIAHWLKVLLLCPLSLAAQTAWTEDAQGCKHARSSVAPRESITWTGGCVDGWADGPGEQKWWLQDRLSATFTGTKVRGQAEGVGTLQSVSGLRYDGDFKDGLRHGKGRLQWPDGTRYEGEFAANQLHGPGVMLFDNGHRYAGRFDQGLLLGEAQITWATGQDLRRLERLLTEDAAWQQMSNPRQGQVRVAPVAQMIPTCTPKYPKAALQAEVTGTTGLAMLVNEEGRVTKVRIVETSGDTPVHKLLDLVTTTAIWDCPFTAGTLDGKPSTMWAKIQYVWRIE